MHLLCEKHELENVHKSCETSIKNLGIQYLDLYLIHSPASFSYKEGVDFDVHDPNSFVFENYRLEDIWRVCSESGCEYL